MNATGTELRPGTEIERREAKPPAPLYNGIIGPDRWAMIGRIAQTVADTEFVPKGLRARPHAVMAALLYGDSLGLHPSVALTDIYIVDGKVGISGALMLSEIRKAGHKIKFTDLYAEDGTTYVGALCEGWRLDENGEVVDEDEWRFTLDDAKQAGLLPASSQKAAWYKTPKVMCRWRALAQLARFLFPDVFRGGSVYLPDENEEVAYAERLRNGSRGELPAQTDEDGIEYGDDPLLAAWLLALFAAANDLDPSIWLPKKVKLALKGRTQDEREELAGQIAAWIDERGGVVPERPTEPEPEDQEPAEEAVGEIVVDPTREGRPEDDPGAHLNGHEHEPTAEELADYEAIAFGEGDEPGHGGVTVE